MGCCISFRSITARVEQNTVTVKAKTKDNVFVILQVAVQQSVMAEKVQDAMYKLSNVEQQVEAYVADVVRSHVPLLSLDEAFEAKDDLSVAVKERLAGEMAEWGYIIHKALVIELAPDSGVVKAMNEINKQRRLRDASIMGAEAEKIKTVTCAEAEADAQALMGEGIARQRRAIVDGLRASVGASEMLSTSTITELLLITQYFDTLRDVAQKNKAEVVMLPRSAGKHDIAAQIRNGMLQGTLGIPQ